MFRLRCLFLSAMSPRAALKILSLSPSTELTHASIKKAYIKQTLQCHPDLNPTDPDANEKFRTLSDALRVALRTLEMRNAGSAAARSQSWRKESMDINDSQVALDALRGAIIAYHAHRNSERQWREGVKRVPQTADERYGETDAFMSPSLEYVSSVCRQEAEAMRRVRAFCDELPAVLSGSSSAALFDAVCFFHKRYVESMSACVLRFSKDLPVIVRKVVKNRPNYVRYTRSKETSGIGTGSRPREQRIEDMAMKPLVLMGALIFDLPPKSEEVSGGDRTASTTHNEAHDDDVSSSTCGVTRPSEVRVTTELKCVIYPADSVGSITEKLGKWEAASFNRLKIELAIVDACAVLSGLLGLEDTVGEHHLAVAPHLELGATETKQMLMVLQKLSCHTCLHFDDALDHAVDTEELVDAIQTANEAVSRDDDAAALALPLPQLVAQCRKLAPTATSTIHGNIMVTFSEDANVMEDGQGESSLRDPVADKEQAAQSNTADISRFQVARHMGCCAAEMIEFAVSVEACADLQLTLLRLRRALKVVLQETYRTQQLLPELLDIRRGLTTEEFVPNTLVSPAATNGTSSGLEDIVDEEAQTYRYRAPISCFPRIFNMTTSRELMFWKLLHSNREYAALHSTAMNPLNLFFECMPYDYSNPLSAATQIKLQASENVSGWVGDAGDACDNAIISTTELENPQAFREWLEDVVEQSSLNKECRTHLSRAGIAYVSRDPGLPLTNFLSFVKVFSQAGAVRSVLEQRRATSVENTVHRSDIGLSIVVGTRCDVTNGGQLLIPWYMDPSVLLALLEESGSPSQLPS